MLSSYLDYQEASTLKAILRHHGVEPTDKLVDNLGSLLNWTRADERAKHRLTAGADQPPFLLVLLGQMGIYGKAALEPEKTTT